MLKYNINIILASYTIEPKQEIPYLNLDDNTSNNDNNEMLKLTNNCVILGLGKRIITEYQYEDLSPTKQLKFEEVKIVKPGISIIKFLQERKGKLRHYNNINININLEYQLADFVPFFSKKKKIDLSKMFPCIFKINNSLSLQSNIDINYQQLQLLKSEYKKLILLIETIRPFIIQHIHIITQLEYCDYKNMKTSLKNIISKINKFIIIKPNLFITFTDIYNISSIIEKCLNICNQQLQLFDQKLELENRKKFLLYEYYRLKNINIDLNCINIDILVIPKIYLRKTFNNTQINEIKIIDEKIEYIKNQLKNIEYSHIVYIINKLKSLLKIYNNLEPFYNIIYNLEILIDTVVYLSDITKFRKLYNIIL